MQICLDYMLFNIYEKKESKIVYVYFRYQMLSTMAKNKYKIK